LARVGSKLDDVAAAAKVPEAPVTPAPAPAASIVKAAETPPATPDLTPPVVAKSAEAPPPPAPKPTKPLTDAELRQQKALHDPARDAPIPSQKITEKGLTGGALLLEKEGRAINAFRDALNKHNDKFGISRDLPPSAMSSKDVVTTTKQGSFARLNADIRRADDTVNSHATPDDLAGRFKEQRHQQTGVSQRTGKPYNHIEETETAYNALKNSVNSIDNYLARNPKLPKDQATYLLERRNGHADLLRGLQRLDATFGTVKAP
jgi:hypothetical protein